MKNHPTLELVAGPRTDGGSEGHAGLANSGTLVERVSGWAKACPERPAVSYFTGSSAQTLSFGELHRQAHALAGTLRAHDLHGRRVLLSCPSGLDFVRGFLACLYAGAVAVPAPFGHGKSLKARLAAIVADCRPHALLTIDEPGAAVARGHESCDPLAGLARFQADRIVAASGAAPSEWPQPAGSSLALLQYTSGSTSEPRGTAITHANLIANQRMLEQAFGTNRDTVIVSWLPLFHDMGLIGMLLHGAYLGARVVLLPTLAVLKDPSLWLRAISRFKGTFSAAPNFAFDLCIDKLPPAERTALDLGSWRTAVNGSEPVRHRTARRFLAAFAVSGFRPSSFAPAYGLAEATLVVSASRAAPPTFLAVDARSLQADVIKPPVDATSARWLVSCGRFDLADQTLRIVDPQRLEPLSDGRIGEIWLAGSHVAQGYFQNPAATAERFGARLPADDRRYLRTGDLGFVKNGQLFITGRIKDLIIVRGQKFYPQDIETALEDASPYLRRGSVAAFGLDACDRQELAVVAEVEQREHATRELVSQIVRALRQSHELALSHVRILTRGGVAKTTSGKIRRNRCRQDYLEGRGSVHLDWSAPAVTSEMDDRAELTQTVEEYALRWLSKRLAVMPSTLNPRARFAVFGLDSLSRVDLLRAVERRFGRPVPDSVAHELDSVRDLACFFASPPRAAPAPSQAERALPRREPAPRDGLPPPLVLPAFSSLPWSRAR
ncbi:MAG TPA: AMP-binding protein [Polyangiaceae bacterium]|nr:AMP-binding protein [Polyangiaceae bacterium]